MARTIRDWRGIKYDLDKMTEEEVARAALYADETAVRCGEFFEVLEHELVERRIHVSAS